MTNMYNIPVDNSWEHEQHRKGENGKVVPFFRNMDKCSTCFSEYLKIKGRKYKTYGGIKESNLIGSPEFAR